jgi:NAD(P)-dependent dehydrogenase (short-subunit alcohol dehydrogenase family)
MIARRADCGRERGNGRKESVMNIQVKTQAAPASRSLAGKVSLVTGSTSGIGLAAQIDGEAKAHGISREQVDHDVLLAQRPNKRFATVEELGALTVFLASDAAAPITRIALPVDGGWTAH